MYTTGLLEDSATAVEDGPSSEGSSVREGSSALSSASSAVSSLLLPARRARIRAEAGEGSGGGAAAEAPPPPPEAGPCGASVARWARPQWASRLSSITVASGTATGEGLPEGEEEAAVCGSSILSRALTESRQAGCCLLPEEGGRRSSDSRASSTAPSTTATMCSATAIFSSEAGRLVGLSGGWPSPSVPAGCSCRTGGEEAGGARGAAEALQPTAPARQR
mmetsp:Transcript_25144/g.70261  ORF Transcript_25144/g.70261 Transcript_25144/m.70261 type:complete len:221 (+) Transcript_25144:4519-5181(+)